MGKYTRKYTLDILGFLSQSLSSKYRENRSDLIRSTSSFLPHIRPPSTCAPILCPPSAFGGMNPYLFLAETKASPQVRDLQILHPFRNFLSSCLINFSLYTDHSHQHESKPSMARLQNQTKQEISTSRPPPAPMPFLFPPSLHNCLLTCVLFTPFCSPIFSLTQCQNIDPFKL